MRWDAALKVLREHKPELEERYGSPGSGFLSVARDEATDESDVDVVVEMAPDLFGSVSLREELEVLLGAKVDLVRYWRRMNHYLKRRIDTEAHYVWWGGCMMPNTNQQPTNLNAPLFDRVATIIEPARANVVRSVNSEMVIAY